MPGTPQHETLRDRVFDRNWSHYDFHHSVFRPARMSPQALEAGHDWVTREFYRPWRIARRLSRHALRGGVRSLPYAAGIEAGYYGRTVRWKIRGFDPARERVATPASGARGGETLTASG